MFLNFKHNNRLFFKKDLNDNSIFLGADFDLSALIYPHSNAQLLDTDRTNMSLLKPSHQTKAEMVCEISRDCEKNRMVKKQNSLEKKSKSSSPMVNKIGCCKVYTILRCGILSEIKGLLFLGVNI